MSNKNIDQINNYYNEKFKIKKDLHNKNSVNNLLKRISSGQRGVVLEMFFEE
ncbi:hypothetical protein [Vibrio navarrensis]|uniref:hypothetical protein n=1 Tax=Vibrio navarrensis TaxID=29495 RepID=UPI00192F56BF|nr:hypothetical protein [Vibrio navarrensis]